MSFLRLLLLLCQQVLKAPLASVKLLLQVSNLIHVDFVAAADDINRTLTLLLIFINAILDHPDHFVISVIIIISQRLRYLFYDRREVTRRERRHQCLPDGESQRFNDGSTFKDLFQVHVHQAIHSRLQFLVLLDTIVQVSHVLCDPVNLHLGLLLNYLHFFIEKVRDFW